MERAENAHENGTEVASMCGNNNGFGGNCWWIICLILLLTFCGGCGGGCESNNSCGNCGC